MKNYLLLLPLLIFTACISGPNTEPYDDTEDLAYLEEYAQQEGVEMTDSGLLYRVIEEGEGERPGADNFVFVNYEGESVDGADQRSNGDEIGILLPGGLQLFNGIGEGVQLMTPGSIYEFVLPTNLATGDGRVYIFELELESFLIDPDEFLNQNSENEDITVTNSGLQYRFVEEGEGESPGAGSVVKIHYKGTYTNGHVFDQSGSDPAEFNLAGLISGFSEGVQLMNEGGKSEIFLPSNIGYGDNPQQGIIPGAVLIFEIELIEIVE